MWTEIAIASGFVGSQGVLINWLYRRINKMEKDRALELGKPGGQTNFMLRTECDDVKNTFSTKFEELKQLIIDMDDKREQAKDEAHLAQLVIGERLAAIEAKLNGNGRPQSTRGSEFVDGPHPRGSGG